MCLIEHKHVFFFGQRTSLVWASGSAEGAFSKITSSVFPLKACGTIQES